MVRLSLMDESLPPDRLGVMLISSSFLVVSVCFVVRS